MSPLPELLIYGYSAGAGVRVTLLTLAWGGGTQICPEQRGVQACLSLSVLFIYQISSSKGTYTVVNGLAQVPNGKNQFINSGI